MGVRLVILLLLGVSVSWGQAKCEAMGQWYLSYPPTARAARIQGTITARVEVGKDGKIASATISPVEGSARLLEDGVRDFLRRAWFLPGCDAVIHELRFEFSFNGEGSYHPRAFIFFVAPNTYRIVSEERFLIAD